MSAPPKVELLVKAYVRIRDDLNEKRKAFKDMESIRKKEMEKLELAIQTIADDAGVESFKTKYGTAFKKTSDFISVKDWSKTIGYIMEHDLRHMFNKSVNKTAAKEFMKANNNMLPPGLEYGQKVEIQVRRN